MRYKIGDSVVVREDLYADVAYPDERCNINIKASVSMLKYRGRHTTIKSIYHIHGCIFYLIDADKRFHFWIASMFLDDGWE